MARPILRSLTVRCLDFEFRFAARQTIAWLLFWLLAAGSLPGDLAFARSIETGGAFRNGLTAPLGQPMHSSGTVGALGKASFAMPAAPALAAAVPQSSPSNVSTISSNFNGTSIPAGDSIWFNSVMKASGIPSSGATITVSGASVQFGVNGVTQSLAVPDSVITFSSSVSNSTTTFDAVHNQWNTTVPVSYSGNVFLAGLSDQLSAALPGGINPVSWTATFYTDKSSVSLQWQWAAAVYTSFSANYGTLGIKPIDATSGSAYANSDHAGTPENYKSFVVGGARGGGGSDWTGSYSGTASVTPQLAANHAPVANAGPNQTVVVGSTVQLDGTASTDPDGLRITYNWSFVSVPSGSSASLTGATGPLSSFVVDKPGNYTVQLIVSDGELNSAPAQVVVSTKNSPPVANAGSNQTVATRTTVQVNGSGSSDVDGDPLTYRWSIVSAPQGSTATLSNTAALNPTFVTDAKGTYVIQLIVNDGIVDSVPAQVAISDVNSPPVANAGANQTLVAGTTVQLNGTGSTDVDGDFLTYSWAILSAPQGSTAALSNATLVNPTFFADKSGTYVVQLIVNDGTVNGQPSTVTITSQNAPPVANAGPNQTVTTQTTVQLDGSKSTDVDGDSLTYHWSLASVPQGSRAILSNATVVNPTFVTDEKGTYVAQLIVNDDTVNSAPSQLTISDVNSPPVANAGPNQTINVGTIVQLDGSHSTDVDGDPLTYRWAILSAPSGSSATLSSTSAVQPTFIADRVGTYVVQLIVNDGTVDGQPSTVTISTSDVPPVANPGPNRAVVVNTAVTLDGSGSTDSDSQPLSYQWSLLSAPVGSSASLASPSGVTTSFKADLPGNYVVQLMVNDGFLNSAAATLTISTNDVPPVANPGPNQTVKTGTTVQLDGTASSDSVNRPLTYRWAILSQPSGSTSVLSNANSAKPTFVPAVVGLYVVQLIVNDGYVDSQPATMTVTATSPNQPPVVNAGPNQTISLPATTATLSGSVTDDGLPNGTLIITWTQISGPGTVTFSNPNQSTTQATLPVVGSYVLQLSASDSQLSSSATITVTLTAANQPPSVSAGPSQGIFYPQTSAILNGSASDDGLPAGSHLTVQWSKLVGPGTVAFSQPTQTSTQATFSLPGNYVLQLSASDGQYTSTGTTLVTFVGPAGGALSVDAGSTQTILYPNSAALTGSVSDPFLPPGGAVAVQWTQISGPGTATFNNANSLTSSVSFSKPGVYDLQLSATDGISSGTNHVLIYVGHLTCTSSNKGTEFWLMFMGQRTADTSSPRFLDLAISGDNATSGVLSVPGSGFTAPFTVTPGQVTFLQVPVATMVSSTDQVENKGIHITALAPVAVAGIDYLAFASDGFLGLPTASLGTDYIVAAYQTGIPGSEFAITATKDNTSVSITPATTANGHNSGVPYNVTLNAGQTYQLRDEFCFGNATCSRGGPADFTGTQISANNPIAVFGGHDCTNIPSDSATCNAIMEQLPPTNLWASDYLTVPLETERNGDFFRVVASVNGTHVKLNNQLIATLDRGQFTEQLLTKASTINADAPIMVVQYAASQGFAGNGNVDPSMAVLTGFEQFGGNYTIATPPEGFDQINFVNVVAPTSAVTSGALLLDGTAIPSLSFVPVGNSGFSGAQVPITKGTHVLTGTVPFGVLSYGFNVADAYSYTGGACYLQGEAGNTLSVSPKTATNPITAQSTVSAVVTDRFGSPLGGVGVTFQITGANPSTSTVTTDSTGTAAFSYRGNNVGTDSVAASADAATDTAILTWIGNGPNQPPVVSAGPNQSLFLPISTLSLVGSVVDDGLPQGGALTMQWSQLSGPAPVSFGAPTQAATPASFTQAGTYVLQLSANDSQLSSAATVTITVFPPNQPPTVNAGPDQVVPFVQNFLQGAPLNGSASDDGLPAGSTLKLKWAQVRGPDIASISSPNAANASVEFFTPGNYVFSLSASDGQYTTTSFTNITAAVPVVTTPATAQGIVNTQIAISGTVTVAGQPIPGLSTNWRVLSFPAGANVTFGSGTSLVTTFQADTPGLYVLQLIAGSSAVNSSINVSVLPVGGASGPSVSFVSPLDGGEITQIGPILGNVSGGSWTLSYAPLDNSATQTFTTIGSGSGTVTNGPLGTFDPTLLLNGLYTLKLTTQDQFGLTATAIENVTVSRNAKVGVFTISFNDLTVPVAGIPIQVIRTYDSRDKSNGDFGIGWRLSLSNVRVKKTHAPGLGWNGTQQSSNFIPQYCLQVPNPAFVTVVFPDGRTYRFQEGLAQSCQAVAPIETATVQFTQMPGPANTAGATLTPLDGGSVVVDGTWPGAVTLFGFDGNTYSPSIFVLKTVDGSSYTIDEAQGLIAASDGNGNALSINANGITSSAGKSVSFRRDARGHITAIVDLAGNEMRYTYSSDLLVALKNWSGDSYAFDYDGGHANNLLHIFDPTGNTVLANSYDASGRLLSTANLAGQSSTFTHDLANRVETVKDALGNTTSYAYDADGNVVQVTDPLGHVTSSTYDASDNKLTDTNALGKTSTYTYDQLGNRLTESDPLGHTTTYTYNALSKPITITDANGHTTTNTYDANGNLLTTTDPLGKITANTYTGRGQLATTKDPLNHTTSFVYDSFGNLTTQTDANNTVTTYTYDGNGNRTSQSVTRTLPGGAPQTLLTQFLYDSSNRLIKTIYPDGASTSSAYNNLGQQSSTTDARGNVTSYSYDAAGRVTFVSYPDGTSESTDYDSDGRKHNFTGRNQVTFISAYDAAGRLTQTRNNATGGVTSTAYDAAGQVISTTDALNHTTQYAYDDAGRRTSVTDALGHVTSFVYDSAGNQTSAVDANNHTTQFQYDAANRRTKTIYADNNFETTAYDALGRVSARTDANGKTTQFGYDNLGRLTSVTDALNQVTSYSYDEVGNRLTQTDANNHTTSYQYDQRGRRVARILPLGQSEAYTYDANGNLATRTDFNGKTTTYAYDGANQLLSKTPDGSFHAPPVTFTYAATQRATMTDASGKTSYFFSQGRLTLLSGPAGALNYSYDLGNNLTKLNGGGFTVNYTYDGLNRLVTVQENNTGTTSYGYDNVGNLQSVTYPNGVVHTYSYDTRNRLTNLGVTKGANNLAGYSYTLDAAGHRTSVAEQSGRTVNYSYDNLYRLTNETIASDPSGINGAVNYTYDPVGNRKQMTSTLPGVAAGLFNYDANDRFTAGDTYDANGNTTASGGIGNVYDFENHLIQKGGVTIVYDGDGNRVAKTVAGVMTRYLVDTLNPTGYAQVIAEEFANTANSAAYVYGLERISKAYYSDQFTGPRGFRYYVYDGHGSARALTDTSGNVTDTYDYDAFGNLVHSTFTSVPPLGSTVAPSPNNYLYSGEQFDPDLNLYYNRARYLNVSTGRFWSMDTFEGDAESPLSLHKYLYCFGDSVNCLDPSGYEGDSASAAAYSAGNITIQTITIPNFIVTLGKVAAGLLIGAGLGALSSVVLASLATSQLRAARDRVRRDAENRRKRPDSRILFHYTTEENARAIFSSGVILGFSGTFGTGAYATDLAGWLAVESLRRSQLVTYIFGRNTTENYARAAWFVAFEELPSDRFEKTVGFRIFLHPGPETNILPLAVSPNLLGE
jgi:RHS repeat-associated protein